jgi:MFS family permease
MSATGITQDAPPASPGTGSVLRARLALTLLMLINLLNYMDRYVLAAVEPRIAKDFFGDQKAAEGPEGQQAVADGERPAPKDEWVEAKMGALSTAFMVSYMLFAPLFGLLADRMSRWWLIGIGVGIWSLASGGSGLAIGFLMLLLTRVFVGVGEAAYGPAAPAVISDMFPVKKRGTVLAWFYAAIPVGSALGFVLGGQMLNVSKAWTGHEDWRWGFYAVVFPGLLLAIFCFFIRETPRGQSDAPDTRSASRDSAERTAPRVGGGHSDAPEAHSANRETPRGHSDAPQAHSASWADYGIILRTPSFVFMTLGYTALTFVQGGVAFWMPHYVSENRGQTDLAQAGSIFGAIVVVSGLFSTVLGGWVADRLRDKLPGAYLLVSGWGVLLAFPLMLCVIFVDFPYAWGFIFLSVFFMFFNTGPINTVIANVIHPSVRASAFALNILVIHLFGDAGSPAIMGWIAGVARKLVAEGKVTGWMADVLGRNQGMDFSMGSTSVFLLLAGLIWLWGARYLERDTALAPHRFARPAGALPPPASPT